MLTVQQLFDAVTIRGQGLFYFVQLKQKEAVWEILYVVFHETVCVCVCVWIHLYVNYVLV